MTGENVEKRGGFFVTVRKLFALLLAQDTLVR